MLRDLLLSHNFQPQVIDQGLNLVVHRGVEEAGGTEEGDGVLLDRFSCWLRFVADEPVGDVDVVLQVLGGGVLVQDRADGDAEIRVLGQLLGPVVESVDVGEGDDLAAFQDQEPVVDAGLAAGGQPEVAGHQASTDECRLFRFDQSHRLARILEQEMLAEQALRERPVLRQLAGLLHQGMHPGDAPGHILVLDAMSCLAVVFHHLARPATAELVNLEEDHVAGAGDADAVFLDQFVDRRGFDDGFQEGHQVGIVVEADAAGNHVVREEA